VAQPSAEKEGSGMPLLQQEVLRSTNHHQVQGCLAELSMHLQSPTCMQLCTEDLPPVLISLAPLVAAQKTRLHRTVQSAL
jgi:hypothetical protein